MASTFFGLHIGSSALSSFQVATNTTANNIANVKTTGYTRQEATLQAKDAINVTARYGSVGTGVTVTSIKQQRDLYYDNKYWENNSCTKIDVAANFTVANVSQMTSFGIFANRRTFDFDKVSNMDIFGEARSWTNMSIWSYCHAIGYGAFFNHRVSNNGTCTNFTIHDIGSIG